MTDEAGKSPPRSKIKIILIGITGGLVLVVLAFVLLAQEIEQHLVAAVEAKLTEVKGLSFQIGAMAFSTGGARIEQVTIRPEGHVDGPGLLLKGVSADVDYWSLLRGKAAVEQLRIDRAALLPDLSPQLDNITASVRKVSDSAVTLTFKGRMEPGQLSGSIEVDRQPALIQARGTLKGEALRFFHPRIARTPLQDIQAEAAFAGRYDTAQDKVQIDEITINSRGLSAVIAGQIEQLKTKPRVALTLDVPTVACQTLVEGLPRDFIPDLQGFQLSGNFSAQLKLAIDFAKLESTQLTGYRGFRSCQTKEAPAHLSQKHFQGSFVHTTRLMVGINQTFQVGPENPQYVPYEDFSDALIGAFLATEDISFFHHTGYVPDSFSLAIGHNLMENRFAMGGSTITMQMVKNVLLSHEKTLSRKIQELFLTDYVERTLGKQRILEIYLNVIEFGPGIFGIGAAAEHYFGKPASDLSALEAVYLASIIYSPRRHYGSYCRGSVSKEWDQRLRQLLQLMQSKALIDQADFEATQDQSIVFRKPPLGCQNTH